MNASVPPQADVEIEEVSPEPEKICVEPRDVVTYRICPANGDDGPCLSTREYRIDGRCIIDTSNGDMLCVDD